MPSTSIFWMAFSVVLTHCLCERLLTHGQSDRKGPLARRWRLRCTFAKDRGIAFKEPRKNNLVNFSSCCAGFLSIPTKVVSCSVPEALSFSPGLYPASMKGIVLWYPSGCSDGQSRGPQLPCVAAAHVVPPGAHFVLCLSTSKIAVCWSRQ
jgi:hypothetical protein